MKALTIPALALLASCTSTPFVKTSVLDQANGQRTDTVCTTKRAVIPWFVGVAGGFFTFKYGEACTEKVSPL